MRQILFHIGPFAVYSYGLFLAIGIFLAMAVIKKFSRVSPSIVNSLSIWTVIGGIIGARLFYVFLNIAYYIQSPLEVFAIHKGGLVLYGGIAGGLILGFIFCKIRKLNFWQILDDVAMGLPLGMASGRLGCFLNGCCYGKETQVLWAVKYPDILYKVHPVQIYEALLLVFLFFVIYGFRKAFKAKIRGDVFLLCIIFYAIIRFFMEFLRGDHPEGVSGLFQIISIFIIVSFTGIMLYRHGTQRG
ncbi:prolipoprotein diacylglyceryl transferase [bacterium Unc6]|nr:prolipoprotein diacylglyceryl transferase [bacterium Unc6]